MLISPITSSNSQSANQASQEKQVFDRFKPKEQGKNGKKEQQPKTGEKEQEEGSDLAQVIPLVPEKALASEKALVAPTPPTATGFSVAHAFVQLLGMFGQQSRVFAQWLGNRAYQNASSQKRGSKFQRGAMLDTRVE